MRRLLVFFAAVAVTGCKCDKVMTIKPSIAVSPPALDFGSVKNGDMATLSLKISAQTNADLSVTKLDPQSGTDPCGAEAFTLSTSPIDIGPLDSQNLPITFHPTALVECSATLNISSNDEDKPLIHVPLLGTGAEPIIQVTPDCAASRMCVGTVVVSPPSIDFGAQPFGAAMMVDTSKLPTVDITNIGQVTLTVSSLKVTGADAAAFVIQGTVSTPLTYDPMAGVSVPIRFLPTSEMQQTYAADLDIESDDPNSGSIKVHLTGTLKPNAPPVVCANLTIITPAPADVDDVAQNFTSTTDWAPLLTVPAGGYDFSSTRDVPPGATVTFSALSSLTDVTKCTTDPEDGRTGLTFMWAVTAVPMGSAAFPAGATPTYSLTPKIVGTYQLSLTVGDMQGHMTQVPIKFAVGSKEDLVAQLSWTGFSGVDLDLHLVRPTSVTMPADPFSGVFSFFNEGANMTSGDINGYAANTRAANMAYNFDWGAPGVLDNPKLSIDDIGNGDLLESIAMNHPEDDALCDGGDCTYKVLVHYVRDYRMVNGPPCFVDGGTGCKDGDACNCMASSDRCVATPPPDGGRPQGAGECRAGPTPVVKIFLKGNPAPALTVPISPDVITMGAPCQTFYAADVTWPSIQKIGSLADGGTPLAIVTAHDGGFALFGVRNPGDVRQCSPDYSPTVGINWYSEQP